MGILALKRAFSISFHYLISEPNGIFATVIISKDEESKTNNNHSLDLFTTQLASQNVSLPAMENKEDSYPGYVSVKPKIQGGRKKKIKVTFNLKKWFLSQLHPCSSSEGYQFLLTVVSLQGVFQYNLQRIAKKFCHNSAFDVFFSSNVHMGELVVWL
ncbi:Obscurin [Manis pentadactyla]|nr:Obscurin [Manis pentadactyla]